MKTISKIIVINDGSRQTAHNGDRLFVQTAPRADAIVSAFLSDGWTLHSRNFRVSPASSQEYYNFYLDGWDFLFTKTVPDDAVDNSDSLLKDAISEALRKNPESPYDEDSDDEDSDDDFSLDDEEDSDDENEEDNDEPRSAFEEMLRKMFLTEDGDSAEEKGEDEDLSSSDEDDEDDFDTDYDDDLFSDYDDDDDDPE